MTFVILVWLLDGGMSTYRTLLQSQAIAPVYNMELTDCVRCDETKPDLAHCLVSTLLGIFYITRYGLNLSNSKSCALPAGLTCRLLQRI